MEMMEMMSSFCPLGGRNGRGKVPPAARSSERLHSSLRYGHQNGCPHVPGGRAGKSKRETQTKKGRTDFRVMFD